MRDCTAVRPRIEVDEKDADYLNATANSMVEMVVGVWIGVVTKMGFVIWGFGLVGFRCSFFSWLGQVPSFASPGRSHRGPLLRDWMADRGALSTAGKCCKSTVQMFPHGITLWPHSCIEMSSSGLWLFHA